MNEKQEQVLQAQIQMLSGNLIQAMLQTAQQGVVIKDQADKIKEQQEYIDGENKRFSARIKDEGAKENK